MLDTNKIINEYRMVFDSSELVNTEAWRIANARDWEVLQDTLVRMNSSNVRIFLTERFVNWWENRFFEDAKHMLGPDVTLGENVCYMRMKEWQSLVNRLFGDPESDDYIPEEDESALTKIDRIFHFATNLYPTDSAEAQYFRDMSEKLYMQLAESGYEFSPKVTKIIYNDPKREELRANMVGEDIVKFDKAHTYIGNTLSRVIEES